MEYIDHPWIYPGKMEKREYQVSIARKSLSGNLLVVLPTGLGKTAIAILSAAYHLEKDMHGKIMVVAPTRPLVEQHRKTFLEFLKIGEDEMKVITGKTPPEKRREAYGKADIVFATPQTISNDIKAERINLKQFQLLVIDEAHRAVGNYSYTFIARMFRSLNPSGRILALTASPSSDRDKIRDMQDALGISIVEIRDETDDDVKDYVHGIDMDYVYVEFPPYLDALRAYIMRIINERMEKLRKWGLVRGTSRRYELLSLQSRLQRSESKIKYVALSVVSEILKLDHAVALIESHSVRSFYEYLRQIHKEGSEGRTKASARIIREMPFQRAVSLAKDLIDEGKEHPKIMKLRQIVGENSGKKMIIFTQYRITANLIHEAIGNIVKSSIFIGQNKGMRQEEQKRILESFRSGEIQCLISTSIGEEGLDIPEVDLVIFYEPVPSEIRFIQRRGRTGRKRQGKVIILITKGTRDERNLWSSYHKRRRMKKVLKTLAENQNAGLRRWYS